MAAIFGLDFGNLNNVAAVARKGGVDIVANETSNRATPGLVAFNGQARNIGEPAQDQYMMNYANTVSCLKRLVGKKFSDPDVKREIGYLPFKLVEIEDGEIGVEVQYQDKAQVFTTISLLAMLFTKMKAITEHESGSKVVDCVISCPGNYTVHERHAVVDAATVAGLNVERLFNETTSAALVYGIMPKNDLPDADKEPINVIFIDVGHASTSCSAVSFVKGKLMVRATAVENSVGGRDFDETLVKHFAKEIQAKYGIDIYSQKKPTLRMRAAAEKVKRVLSANAQAPLNVEMLMNDVDVSCMMERAQFEEIADELLHRFMQPVKRVMAESGLTLDKIYTVELIGSGSRVPAIAQKIKEFFGKEVSRTLDAAECVAKGCALQAAILSPQFRVREFTVQDVTPFNISVSWLPTSENSQEDTTAVVFPKGSVVPSVKMLSFTRAEPFEISCQYLDDPQIPEYKRHIAKFRFSNIPATRDGQPGVIKVKIGVSLHGTVYVESAQLVEEYEVEEPAPVEKKADKKKEADKKEGEQKGEMDVDGNAPAAEAAPAEEAAAEEEAPKMIKKKKVHRVDVTVESFTSAKPKAVIDALTQAEFDMALQDKVLIETMEKKNAVEAYVYDMRDKVSGPLSEFVKEADKDAFLSLLTATEDWLYDEGEDTTKGVYSAKLDELKKHGDPIELRAREHAEFPVASSCLRSSIDSFREQSASTDEKYAHIEAEEKQRVVTECNTVDEYLASVLAARSSLSKTDTPPVLSSALMKKRNELEKFCSAIMNKPKPKPKAEPKAEEPKTESQPEPSPSPGPSEGSVPPESGSEAAEPPAAAAEMDLD